MCASALRRGIFLAILLAGLHTHAQPALQEYIEEGLRSNQVLQGKRYTLEKSLKSLEEARSYFLPSSSFEGTYNLAGGGRSIDIPIGDLLNPVYSTLNQLTGSTKFPTIQNASEQFLPNNFYDVRVRTTMPLVNPDIRIQKDIREQEVKLAENEIRIYQRELIRDIKTAYYQFLMATEAIRIYEYALQLVEQNVRANESLLNNGKGLPAYLSRAQSERQQVMAQLENARNEQKKAQAYLNFLVNQPMDRTLRAEIPEVPAQAVELLLEQQDGVETREELRSLQLARDIRQDVLRLNKSFRVPRVNTFLDLGSQGFDFAVNDQSLYYLFGLQMQVPIFQGRRNLLRIEQTQIDIRQLELQTGLTQRQLQLAAFQARTNARNAYHNWQASTRQAEAARQYYKLIDRGYKEGVNTFIEFLDARNQFTQSEIQVSLNKYKLAAAVAEYERQTAASPIPIP